jgi:TetR/AcrR family fatty acid metabolism transcriptional regulator
MDDKRQRMIEAARKRFRYDGVKKTTMQEIARDAGVAVGTLYLYFKDKADLLVRCAAGSGDPRRARRVRCLLVTAKNPLPKTCPPHR